MLKFIKRMFARSKAESDSADDLRCAVDKNRKTSEGAQYQSAVGSMKVQAVNALIAEVLKSMEAKRDERNLEKSGPVGRSTDNDHLRDGKLPRPKLHRDPST